MSQVVGEDLMVGMGYIGLDSGRLYRMRRGPKLIEAVASGTTIIINDATEGRPFRGLRVFGRTEQVQTTGAQLINTQGAGNSRGVDWVFDKGVVTFSGVTVDTSTNRVNCAVNVKDVMEIGKTYFAKSFTVGIVSDVAVEKPSGVIYTREYTPDGTETGICIRVLVDKSNDAGIEIDLTAYVAITENERLSSWEPYTGGKPSPSPEYKQEPEDAGKDGSIEVKVGGRNLFDGKFESGSIRQDNGENQDYADRIRTAGFIQIKPSTVYSIKLLETISFSVRWYDKDKKFIKSEATNTISQSPDNARYMRFLLLTTKLDTKCMVYAGSAPTPYEPYRDPQTLTLATPNGLPGIPVTKDGNYTDADGQQWVCDEIDLERGKYVQRVVIENISGGWELKPSSDISGRFLQSRLTNVFQTAVKTAVCNIANFVSWGAPTNDIYAFALNKKVIYFSPPKGAEITAEELNAKLNSLSFPVVVVGELATPIERDLTPEEIAAYKALRTYGPTTVVSNDAGAEMEITYRKDKKNEKIHWNKVD